MRRGSVGMRGDPWTEQVLSREKCLILPRLTLLSLLGSGLGCSWGRLLLKVRGFNRGKWSPCLRC